MCPHLPSDSDTQLINSLIFRIHQLVILTDRFADSQLQSRFGLSLPQFLILYILRCFPEANQKMVADHLNVTPAAVSKLIEKLERAGILCKSQTQVDRRQHCWQMTDMGVQKFEKALAAMKKMTGEAEAVLTAAEIADMHRMLDKIFVQIQNTKNF